MSFLYRTQPVLRTAVANIKPSPRLFSTAVCYQKSHTDTVKDAVKSVDRTISDAAVAGIDKGVEMKDKAASAIGIDVEKPAENTTVKASGDVKDEALNKAKDVKAEAKGKATEVKEKVS